MTHFVVVVLQWPDVEEGALTVASDGAILSGIWVKHCDVGDDVVDVRVLTNPRAVEVQLYVTLFLVGLIIYLFFF